VALRAVSPFPPGPKSLELARRGRVVRETTAEVVWEGLSRDAEAEAAHLNTTTEEWQSFRPEELADDGSWHAIGFRRRSFSAAW
jgi:hypothetical protein